MADPRQPAVKHFDVFAAEVEDRGDPKHFFTSPIPPDQRKERKSEHDRHVERIGRTRHFDLLCELGLVPARPAQEILPAGAYVRQIKFTLARVYTSKDDPSLYPEPNSIRREHVFKMAMVSGATWKGSIRAAAIELLIEKYKNGSGGAAEKARERAQLWRIFGDEKSGDPDYDAPYKPGKGNVIAYLNEALGLSAKNDLKDLLPWKDGEVHTEARLRCLPTFFDEHIVLDAINPRNRRTRAGSGVISMEVVPARTKGVLTLVYVPYDRYANGAGGAVATANEDWPHIAKAVAHMFLVTGFGGKKSNSCGTTIGDVEVDGTGTTLDKLHEAVLFEKAKNE
jgi:CRISPR-associated protein Cmr2